MIMSIIALPEAERRMTGQSSACCRPELGLNEVATAPIAMRISPNQVQKVWRPLDKCSSAERCRRRESCEGEHRSHMEPDQAALPEFGSILPALQIPRCLLRP